MTAPSAADGAAISKRRLRAGRLGKPAGTGPTSAAGKARSARNARKHGLNVAAMHDPDAAADVALRAEAIAPECRDPELIGRARRIAEAHHSALICAAAITRPHNRVSSAKNAAASAGEPIIGSRVSLARLSATSGRLRLATTSALIRLARAAGVAGGATTANQVTERKSGSPDSASAGTSGTTGERPALPTASILTLPARYIGTEVVSVSKNMSIWPAMTSLSAGTAPR